MVDEEIFESLARMGRALASPSRLKLLHLLSQCDRSVESLAEAADEPIRSVSHHLQRLKAVQLVQARREGRHVIYGLADPSVAVFWATLRLFAEQQMVDLKVRTASLTEARTSAGKVDLHALQDLFVDGRVKVLDVRPAEEYQAGHLPGALSIPLDQLDARIAEVPPGEAVVVYCRGPYCLLADRAVEKLQERGVRALRLSEGVVEWAASGRDIHRPEPK